MSKIKLLSLDKYLLSIDSVLGTGFIMWDTTFFNGSSSVLLKKKNDYFHFGSVFWCVCVFVACTKHDRKIVKVCLSLFHGIKGRLYIVGIIR